MLAIRTILHPTDFSPQSTPAFQVACALARDYVARLVLLHVHPPDMMYGEGYVLPPDPEVVRAELQERLNGLRPPDPAVRVERLLSEGDAARQILHTARDVGADVIVLGTHGRTGLGRLLMGSVAEAVLRQATCPVLAVKAPLPETPAATDTLADQIASGPGLIRWPAGPPAIREHGDG
jgi:nucleotide-binding universal stress UspA family protein